MSYSSAPGGRWKGEYVVAILEDFQNQVNKPQIHTVLEVIPAKTKDGEFIFPLKEEYEKRRNVVSASSSSDKTIAQTVSGEVQLNAKSSEAFDVPPQVSDQSMQTKVVNDAGPIDERGNTEQIEEAPQAETEITHAKTDTKPQVGFDESIGKKTSHYKGSSRPPDIPGEIWAMMTPKNRQIAKDRYAKTGYGFPKEASKDAEKSKLPSSTSSGSRSLNLVNVPEMPTLAIRKEKLKLQHCQLIADVEERCMQICVARSVSKGSRTYS